MAADIEKQPSSSKLTGKKRKRKDQNQKLLVDERVEVRGIEEDSQSSWHSATVIGCNNKKRMVKYDHFLSDDHTGKLIETLVISPHIRPLPPPIIFEKTTLRYGQCVDVFHKKAWWEGVIIDGEYGLSDRQIFFPDIGDEMTAQINNLRISQDYDQINDKWKPRGKWMFLELLAEIEEEWPVVISVRQIWYEARQKMGFENFNEWNSIVKESWKDLVFTVVLDNFKLSVRGVFVNLNPKQDKKIQSVLDRVVSEIGLESMLPPNVKSQTSQPIQESEFKKDSSMPRSAKSQTSQPIQESEIKDDPGMPPSFKSQTSEPVQESEPKEDSSMLPSAKSQTGQHIQESDIKDDSRITPNVKSQTSQSIQESKLKDDSSMPPSAKSQTSQQPIQESEFKDDLASLMEGGSFTSLLTKSTTVHVTSPQPLDLVPFSPDSCQIDSKSVRKRLKSLAWHIAGPDLVPEPEYCPSAITEYNKKYTERSKPSSTDMANVRKHLKFLGWKIEYWKDNKCKSKYRYYSPESKPKLYYSLHLLCKDLAESCQNDQNIIDNDSRDSCRNDRNTPRGKSLDVNEQQADEESKDSSKVLSLNDQNALTPCSPLPEVVEKESAVPEYCPESITEYVSLGGVSSRARTHDKKVKDLRLKVKKHLFFSGWSFFYIKKGARRELRYQSPGGRVYISLLTACQSYVANDGKSDKKSHNSRRKRSSIRARNYIAPSHHTPRTILCWLIDNEVITVGEKVFHGGKNGDEGRVMRDGIECGCCLGKFSLTELEFHLGGKNRIPASNIYLEDGRSILDCQREVKNVSSEAKGDLGNNSNDYICSVCHDGGDLILCDQCPSSFHISCLGLKDVPEGDWFCPSCCCGVCGKSGFNKDSEKFTDNTLFICDQCEHQYHVGCVNGKNLETLESYPKGKWFCNKRCEQIFEGLEGLLGKPVAVEGRHLDNLTWTLLKNVKSDICNDDDELTENYSKLNVALGVMHECFERVKEPRTDRDIVEDVLFNRWSDLRRLNFKGFYTVVLERNDEIISAATVRVFGEKVAEVPLVGTAFQFRRLGMCRVLMDELEKKLRELGVEMLVLPAISSVLDTWTGRFGFSKMTEPERLNLLDYTFLYFQDTTMCRKLLLSNSELIVVEEQNKDDLNVIEMMDTEGNGNVPEEFLALQIHDSGNVAEKSLGAIDATNNGDCTNHNIVKPVSIEYPPLQNELKDSQYDECEKDEHGFFKCYKRRKVPACGS